MPTINTSECLGAQTAGIIIEVQAVRAKDTLEPGTIPTDQKENIDSFFSDYQVEFVGDSDPTPHKVSYECRFKCGQCAGQVLLSVNGILAEVTRPPECAKIDTITVVSTEEFSADIAKTLAEPATES
jgi:hypothetical protein